MGQGVVRLIGLRNVHQWRPTLSVVQNTKELGREQVRATLLTNARRVGPDQNKIAHSLLRSIGHMTSIQEQTRSSGLAYLLT